MDAAACIGCGACAAACKNGSAMLFVSAKVSQLALLPQGKVEAARRAKAMVAKMENWALVTVRTLALAKWNVRRTSPLATSLA